MKWWPHLRPREYLVERKSRHHNTLIRVLTDREGSFGLQEVMDLLIIHLGKKDKRKIILPGRATERACAGVGRARLSTTDAEPSTLQWYFVAMSNDNSRGASFLFSWSLTGLYLFPEPLPLQVLRMKYDVGQSGSSPTSR